jgi:hypothetical protein
LYGFKNEIFAIPKEDGTMQGAALQFFSTVVVVKLRSLNTDELPQITWMIGLNSLGARIIQSIDQNTIGVPPIKITELFKKIYPFFKQ